MGGAHILAAAIAGAFIVLFGALYALLFALSRLWNSGSARLGAYVSYGLLVGCTGVLADRLALAGPWILVAAVMLIGYLLAPWGIWHLCVGTHSHRPADAPPITRSTARS
jgi:hypothetical protein